MATRALIVGCNYPEDSRPLTGVTDALNFNALLTDTFALEPENVLIMVDDGESCSEESLPTAHGIKASLSSLIEQSVAGDSLVFYFAGHGTQVPAADDEEEADGADEALVSCDFNLITDDDLREVLVALPEGVKFTMISDSCHSGTLLDHAAEANVEGPSEIDGVVIVDLDALVAEAVTAAGGEGRYIDIMQKLTERCGFDVTPKNVRETLVALHRENCTAKYRGIFDYINSLTVGDMVDTVNEFLAMPDNQEHPAAEGLRSFVHKLEQELGGPDETARGWLDPITGFVSDVAGGVNQVADTVVQVAGTIENAVQAGTTIMGYFKATPRHSEQIRSLVPRAGSKPEDCLLPPGQAILLSGCMSDQLSADTGDGGAFTNTLLAALRTYQESNPDVPITNRTLVWCVRSALVQMGAEQTPCLECLEEEADAPFLLPLVAVDA